MKHTLLISGLLLIFLGLGILASPYVLTVASLIPLVISMGLAEEYFPKWKTYFKWFAAIGFLAIAITSIGGMDTLKKIAVPLIHGVAGLVIFLGPFYAKGAPKGFWWVGIGGVSTRMKWTCACGSSTARDRNTTVRRLVSAVRGEKVQK